MKRLYLLLALTVLLASCDNKNDGGIERKFYLNAELDLPAESEGTYVNWTQGEKTIFRFVFTHPDEKNVSDDELSEIFWVEIPADYTSFRHVTGQSNFDPNVEFYYSRSCFCLFPKFEFIRLDVSGSKISNNQWQLEFDIIAATDDSEYPLKDKGFYTLDTFDW